MTNSERLFSQTVAEHKSTIYTVCYMFSQDADEVNDLFQEVLVNLWKGFEGFEHRSDIRTWIYRVALNTCISIDRRKKRRSSEVRLTMDINLFEDRDEDTRQVDRLLNGLLDRLERLHADMRRRHVLQQLQDQRPRYDEQQSLRGSPKGGQRQEVRCRLAEVRYPRRYPLVRLVHV